MSANVERPAIGQWYVRVDRGELFQVVGHDERSHTIQIQRFDGDIDEIDADRWRSLSLERGEPPENWTGPMDDVETDDLGYSETEMKPEDWRQSFEPLKARAETWEDARPEDERDPLGEGNPPEAFSADVPEADERT